MRTDYCPECGHLLSKKGSCRFCGHYINSLVNIEIDKEDEILVPISETKGIHHIDNFIYG